MPETEALIAELKQRIVETLELEVQPATIETDAPLFKEGLGLDSIDALELVVMVEQHYGIRMKQMAEARSAFASVRTLADFVDANRKAP